MPTIDNPFFRQEFNGVKDNEIWLQRMLNEIEYEIIMILTVWWDINRYLDLEQKKYIIKARKAVVKKDLISNKKSL